MGFWQKLFGPSPRREGVREDESIESLHAEFCRTFCHRPGVNFIAALRAEGVTRLIDWLDPSTPCPLPKGFVRLAVDATRRGVRFWDQPGISMMYEGNWSNGGRPGTDSTDALSVLAQVLGKPIKVFYRPQPDAEVSVLEFQP